MCEARSSMSFGIFSSEDVVKIFRFLTDEKIPKDMLDLASHIVESKAGHFEPERFEDQYEDALKGAAEEKAVRP